MSRTKVSMMALAAVAFAAPLAGAQTIKGSRQAEVGQQTVLHVDNYVAPKNAWGVPDLNGLYTNATLTTLERQAQYGDRLVMTPEEAQKIDAGEAKSNADGNKPTDPKAKVTDLPVDCGRGFTGVNCGYNGFWVDPGSHIMNINGEFRTSFLVEPKNGRLPPRVGAAPGAPGGFGGARPGAGGPPGGGAALARGGRGDNPESMTLAERCLKDFGSSSGPPMMPLLYNNTYQIVQSPTDVMILTEMVHDARIVHIVPKDKVVHSRPSDIKQWMGDSVGYYDGNQLVVETTNFRPGQGFRGLPSDGKLIERFERVNDHQIKYTFEVNDPKVFTAPIKAEIAMNNTKGPLYEYACHEGNYALPHILAGNRRADEEAAAKQAAASAAPAAAPTAKPAVAKKPN